MAYERNALALLDFDIYAAKRSNILSGRRPFPMAKNRHYKGLQAAPHVDAQRILEDAFLDLDSKRGLAPREPTRSVLSGGLTSIHALVSHCRWFNHSQTARLARPGQIRFPLAGRLPDLAVSTQHNSWFHVQSD